MEKYFITATGTGVGKTFVTTSLCRHLMALEKKIVALKPVISGYNNTKSDTQLILESCALPITQENIDKISPWRFSAPLSPNMAAEKEGRKLNLNEIVSFCQQPREAEIVLVEGVGGVCVPLNNEYMVLDWINALQGWKVVLVCGSYLGAISHTITAFKALETIGIKLHRLIINESFVSEVSPLDTLKSLKFFLPNYVSISIVEHNQQSEVML